MLNAMLRARAEIDSSGPEAAIEQRDFSLAAERAKARIASAPDVAGTYVLLAYALHQAYRNDEAVAALQTAPAPVRTNPFVRLELARLHLARQSPDDAFEELAPIALEEVPPRLERGAIHEVRAAAHAMRNDIKAARTEASLAASHGFTFVREQLEYFAGGRVVRR